MWMLKGAWRPRRGGVDGGLDGFKLGGAVEGDRGVGRGGAGGNGRDCGGEAEGERREG